MELVTKKQANKVRKSLNNGCPMELSLRYYEEDKFKIENIRYKDSNGNLVVVLSPPLNNSRNIICATFHGTHWATSIYESIDELISITPWDHLKIDDPVIVWNDKETRKYIMYFAGVKNGKPTTFIGGCTSLSINNLDNDNMLDIPNSSSWDHCELYTGKGKD